MGSLIAQVTLKDVARRAKCSTAVVSTIVNNAKGNTLVSEETRARVLQAARELGYRPHFASRSLASRRTRTLGIYIPPDPWAGVGFSYEGSILRGIETAAMAQGYDLLLINVTGRQDAQCCLRKFAERRMDGLLILHAEPGGTWIQDLLQASRNIVAVDYSGTEPGLDTVGFDNQAVGRVAVEHLVALGHRRIGFIGTCKQPPNLDATLRQEGYEQAMAAAGLKIEPEWIYNWKNCSRVVRPDDPVCQLEGQLAARYIVAMGPGGPTAWIAYADLVAVHVQRDLQAAGMKVPQDISVVGVDDSDWARFVHPQLTSVQHPLEEIGAKAATLLIQKSEQNSTEATEPVKLVLQPKLVARESTAAPREA